MHASEGPLCLRSTPATRGASTRFGQGRMVPPLRAERRRIESCSAGAHDVALALVRNLANGAMGDALRRARGAALQARRLIASTIATGREPPRRLPPGWTRLRRPADAGDEGASRRA